MGVKDQDYFEYGEGWRSGGKNLNEKEDTKNT
jgi:hypothetical protein